MPSSAVTLQSAGHVIACADVLTSRDTLSNKNILWFFIELRCVAGANCAQVGQAWLKVEELKVLVDFQAWPMVLVAVAGACGNIHTVVLSEDKQSLVCTESDAGGTVGTGGREGTSENQYRSMKDLKRQRNQNLYFNRERFTHVV